MGQGQRRLGLARGQMRAAVARVVAAVAAVTAGAAPPRPGNGGPVSGGTGGGGESGGGPAARAATERAARAATAWRRERRPPGRRQPGRRCLGGGGAGSGSENGGGPAAAARVAAARVAAARVAAARAAHRYHPPLPPPHPHLPFLARSPTPNPLHELARLLFPPFLPPPSSLPTHPHSIQAGTRILKPDATGDPICSRAASTTLTIRCAHAQRAHRQRFLLTRSETNENDPY